MITVVAEERSEAAMGCDVIAASLRYSAIAH